MINYSDEEINELSKKGLFENGKPNKKYSSVYKKYKALLEKVLNEKLGIKSFDEELQKSNLDFRSISQNQKDYYQSNSSINSSYLYLRNDLYINRLSKEVIDRVYDLSQSEIDNPNDELINLVINTYKAVIYCGYDGFKSYGPDSEEYWKDSSSLVFGFRYNEFPEDVNDDDFDDYNYSQIQFLNEYLDEKKKIYSNNLGVNVEIIWYNEFTIDNSRKEIL